jgi:hypothetical protein
MKEWLKEEARQERTSKAMRSPFRDLLNHRSRVISFFRIFRIFPK